MTRRLLLVHAHPDDESITTGGTIALYASQPDTEVRVITCTLGEEGEVIGERWAQLAADQDDQLGGYRIAELTAALAALHPTLQPRFLGGAGHWRDSGMAADTRHPRAFVGATDAVAAVAAEIADFAPQVVVTYDEIGGYGHPDHIRAHDITRAAVAAAPGVQKLYWTVFAESAITAAMDAVTDVPAGWRRARHFPAHPDAEVTTAIDVSSVLAAKLGALRAHATQITVAADGRTFALSNNIAQPVLDVEHFIRVDPATGVPLPADTRLEGDLFAGLSRSQEDRG